MAHSHAHLREVHAGRKRAHAMAGKFKKGGAVHSDEAQDRKLVKKMMSEEETKESKVEGRASGGRLDKFARGGKTKGKGKHGNHVNIAIVNPHGAAGTPPPGAMPPMPPPGAPPMGGPPMGGPPGGAPPMPPGMPPGGGMYKGGRAYKSGGKVPMKAGAMTGEGRKEKIKAYGLKPIKGKDE